MDAYQFVFPHYAFGHRHYHGIEHVNRMLADAYRYGDHKKIITVQDGYGALNRDLYEAILFHDVVYDGIRADGSTNEIESAEVYKAWAKVFDGRKNHTERVISMILATEHHFDGTVYDDYLTNLLLDLDLMAFTDDWMDFLATQKKIDAEFLPFFSKEVVSNKRFEFLHSVFDKKLLRFRVIDESGVLRSKAYRNLERLLTSWAVYND